MDLTSYRTTRAWRSDVAIQHKRLEDEAARVPVDHRDPLIYPAISADLQRAATTAATPSNIATWWSGSLVETAWSALQAARESLALVETDEVARARLPYVRQMASRTANSVELLKGLIDDHAVLQDRQLLRQVWEQVHVASDAHHASVRRLRNLLIAITTIVAIVILVAFAFADDEHRRVIGFGLAAGALTGVVPVATGSKVGGPYGVALPQVLIKVAVGGLAAFLSVALLRAGLAGFKPAVGDTAYFYAVLFGISQQALTQLADKQVSSLSGATTGPRMRIRRVRASGPRRLPRFVGFDVVTGDHSG